MFKINPLSKSQPKVPSFQSPLGQSGQPPAGNEVAKDNTTPSPFLEQKIRARAHKIWKRRIAQGKSGTPEQDWQKAIEELQLSWWDRWWAWTGIPDKKGWDLVQLLTSVSIPVVIFAGGSWFTYWNNQQQQRIADDKAKQDTLVKYLDDMSKSIEGGLSEAAPGSKGFIVAQSRTVLALQSLDKKRQQLVIQFLQASGLNRVSDDKDTKKFLNELDEYYRGDWSEKPKLPKNIKLGLLYGAQMEKANLTNSDLSRATLIGANLSYAKLGCNPLDSKERVHCSDLSFIDLRGAALRAANLEGTNLSGTYLDYASLRYASLEGANLYSAQLKDADLHDANLIDAKLERAYLGFANLDGADLYNADLSNAILLRTDLANAWNLTPEQLTGKDAPLLCNVRFPKNIKGIDPNRDCDQVPQELLRRYPKSFPNLEEAKEYVNSERQEKFK